MGKVNHLKKTIYLKINAGPLPQRHTMEDCGRRKHWKTLQLMKAAVPAESYI